MGRFPLVNHMTAGLIFMGTPHVGNHLDALREALRNTASALGDQDAGVDDSQAREYITAVGKINRFFLHYPSPPTVLSIWEEEPTEFVRRNTKMSEMVRYSGPSSRRKYT
jgi:hypothetical protein